MPGSTKAVLALSGMSLSQTMKWAGSKKSSHRQLTGLILFPRTITATEGGTHMRESVSSPVDDHVYRGSMRGRLPTQRLMHSGRAYCGQRGRQIDRHKVATPRVAGRENSCVIRSGHNWPGTNPHERELHLRTMHPVLIKGMNVLAYEGSDLGFLSNRFMEVVDPSDSSKPTDKTFRLGYFDDLASLEG